MGLLDGIEKLINEHGSAVILKERIALANDQYAILGKRVTELEAENNRFKLENEKLKIQFHELEKKSLSSHNNQLKFDDTTGTWIDENSNLRYCSKCKSKNISSPLKNESYGWRCPVCNEYFSDPLRPEPDGSVYFVPS